MAFDRDDTLKKAEKLLRQGRLDPAIAEYERVVEDQPRDWNTANTLGDLYARAGHVDKAAAQYLKIADHLTREGFYPKAAALYKKILKFKSDDEPAQLQLAELSVRQGLLADAKSHFMAVVQRRRGRGDQAGAEEIVVRLGSIDPADIDARQAAARVLEQHGDPIAAAMRYRDLHADLLEKGREGDAAAALREAVRLNPDDREGRIELARGAVAAGDFGAARRYLDRDTAGEDPALLLALVNIDLRAGDLDKARDVLPRLIAIDRELRHRIVELAWTLVETSPSAAFVCVDSAVEASTAASDYADAASLLQEFVTRVPAQIPALLKLVEICVDGGLEAPMYEAQAQLADAYLASDQAAEARVIAEDLVAREPWEPAHIERFRRALVMLKVSDPDTMIAERLSGHAPFMARDHFGLPVSPGPADGEGHASPTAPAAQPAVAEPEPAPAEAPRPAAEHAATPGEIDLTRLLGDLQGTPTMSTPTPPNRDNLDEVFQDFRKEVSRQAGAEEAGDQVKLARTYLEMGMADEAITALKTAARSPRYRFEAAGILARLYRQRNETTHAIEWFERAAEAPAPAAEDGRGLLYELGALLESSGETARALAVFLELQADAGDYRDVAARVDRLSRVETGG